MWKRERHLDRDVLPIYSDLKFRLQHNGLRLRHKHRYRTLDINCVFHCPAVETAKHLFWDCPTANTVWEKTLHPLRRYFQTPLQWSTVVYWTVLDLCTEACQNFGTHNLLRVISVIRFVVLKTLWTERNNTIFRTNPATGAHDPKNIGISVTRQATYQIKAHLQRLGRIDALNTRLFQLCALYIDTWQSASVNTPQQQLPHPPHQTSRSTVMSFSAQTRA